MSSFRSFAPTGPHSRNSALAPTNFYLFGVLGKNSQVVAYALYNLSAANDPSKRNDAIDKRARLAESMTAKQIDVAQTLAREMGKPANLLRALDQYVKNPTIKERTKPVATAEATRPRKFP